MMHARMYWPLYGRFLSPDPILGSGQLVQSWNRYMYVMGNPTTMVDPTGLQTNLANTPNCADEPEHELCIELGGPDRVSPGSGVFDDPWSSIDFFDTIGQKYVFGPIGDLIDGLQGAYEYTVDGVKNGVRAAPCGAFNLAGDLLGSQAPFGGSATFGGMFAARGAFTVDPFANTWSFSMAFGVGGGVRGGGSWKLKPRAPGYLDGASVSSGSALGLVRITSVGAGVSYARITPVGGSPWSSGSTEHRVGLSGGASAFHGYGFKKTLGLPWARPCQ